VAISYIANGLGSTTATTSFSVTLPATQAGDILLLEYTHRGTGDATLGGTYAGPAFTEKHDQQYATSTFSGKTLWSRATGNHSGETVTGSGLTDSCAAIVTVYRGGTRLGDPLTSATIVGEQNASANETQAQITTNRHGAMVVLVVANSPDVAVSTQACTTPGALTERAELLSTGGTDTSISHASEVRALAGATGSFTWAQTDGASGSWAYAITPEQAEWLNGRATFRRRRNSTNRRRIGVWLNDQNPAPPPPSGDSAIGVPFTTRIIASRHVRSAGWIAALAAYIQAPAAQPVSAWMAPVVQRRRATTRRLIVVSAAAIERYTPPSIAWSDPPKVIRIEYKRTLQKQAPQLLFPPPTGPPAAYYPAWAIRQLPATFQDRHALSVPELNVYPETPKPEPNLCARIQTGFLKRRDTKRRLLELRLDSYQATPAVEPSDDRALDVAFVTRRIRSRRLLKAPSLVVASAASPPTSEAPLPAWKQPQVLCRSSKRKLLRLPELDRYPATPAAPAQPIAALPRIRVKRRRSRQGLFLSGGGVVEARVQPQFPSWAVRDQAKRKSTTRTLVRAPGLPSAPTTPAVSAQPVAAWQAKLPFRRHGWRTLRRTPELNSYPVTPPVGAQPVSAWASPKQHRKDFERTLQPAAPQPSHPATPPVVIPETAWRAPVVHRIKHSRKIQPAAAQIVYPRIHPISATPRVDALKRRETERRLRVAQHGPSYPGTPAPPQAPTAFKLAEVFRRHGWRRLREVLELDEYPETPERSKQTVKRTVVLDEPNRTLRVKAPSRTSVAGQSKRTEKP